MLGQHGYLSTPSFNLKLEGGTTTQFPARFRTLLRHSHGGHIAKSFLQGSRVFFHAINQGASSLRLEFHFFLSFGQETGLPGFGLSDQTQAPNSRTRPSSVSRRS